MSRGPRRSAALRGEEGVTLVELMVSIFVASLVMAATVTLIAGVGRTSARNEARLDQVNTARNSVEVMARSLRSAVRQSQLLSSCAGCTAEPAVVSASGYSVVLYSNLDNTGNNAGPRKVSYAVATSGTTAGQLTEVVQRPDSATPGAGGYQFCTTADSACAARRSTRLLASGVRTDGTVPLFSYLDAAGAALAGSTLSSTQREAIVAVELSLRVVGTSPSARGDTTFIQRVLLPNAQALFVQQQEGS
ncbi:MULTISPECIES: PulJ/GspJ family protein [unclassified Modestobacter]|uniref:PulJ/GspJ family protein n=1 Tax=unclassified Modestobacter TaxID=2643866 RepID=UPI0022AA1739|nr:MULTISPECIES: prepilin-type N-terminal cleavage/methylation domain-containing protein [unclassified Modestobacter]MCZ2824683.1 prepilin-type N-terminal cleavage/methylation domain-containing protein [Modestobacter sp. VKM Ac-2981]MCZ2854814.1 prepilin-type N-terminal cleavage/methylation domain-containing protein [Modestobacter sp. VKM Ac-2982]